MLITTKARRNPAPLRCSQYRQTLLRQNQSQYRPVLSEINKSNASKILSSKAQPGDIELMDVIIYVGQHLLQSPYMLQFIQSIILQSPNEDLVLRV
ncbi:TPA: hypothetical protein NQN85_000987 [Legionella pneumophila]|nr:hypothetical protein [Legionella pneumophila]HDU8292077.1 hypothetical protein [Legionella pneumophila]